MQKTYYVYIMTNSTNSVYYTGVTNDLQRRVYEHKNKLVEGFSTSYSLNKLIIFEMTDDIEAAIAREKQLKGGSRRKKEALIKGMNPVFKDLSAGWFE